MGALYSVSMAIFATPALVPMPQCPVILVFSSLTEQEAPINSINEGLPHVQCSGEPVIVACCNSLSIQVLPVASTNKLVAPLVPPLGFPRRLQDHSSRLLVFQRLLKGPYAGRKSAVLPE